MSAFLRSGNIILPDPISLSVNDEIIWSSDTGRTMDGIMVGDIIAEKKCLSIGWAFLQEKEIVIIKNTIVAGFVPLTFRDAGLEITIQVYRGTLQKEQLGRLGDGVFWYRSASVDLIQQ